jgi:ketosteroid isomerase-like protein
MKIGAVIVAAALIVSGAVGQGKGSDRATFEKMYNQAEAQFAKKDVAAITKSMTPDFTETSMGQTMNKTQAVKGLKQFLSMFTTVKCELKIKSVKVNGNTAVVTNSAHLWGMGMPDPKTKKPHKMDATRGEECTWVKVKGQWMLKHIKGSNERMLMDGKPMPMSAGT